MKITEKELLEFLEEKYNQYNRESFIDEDPVCIPHLFDKKEDIEIAAFLSSAIAWGQRKTIIANARSLMTWMDFHPHDFIKDFSENDLRPFKSFSHRTFNSDDCVFFLKSLKNIYNNNGGLEEAFDVQQKTEKVKNSILHFRKLFLELSHIQRIEKHVSNPLKNSSSKRLNLFLRWMVRKDNRGVDFGLWKKISASDLICPLDVHTGRIARKLGILKRTQNDWKAAEEMTITLRKFDPIDPVRFDYALFGLGVYEKF